MISNKAKIGKNVSIGEYTTIHDNVKIGDGTIIESNCIIGLQNNNTNGDILNIGKNSHIRSHTVIYGTSNFKEGFMTGHHVLIREKTEAGINLRVGSYTELEGDSKIGDYVRIHSNVMLSRKTKVGDLVWIFPGVQTSTDPLPPSEVEAPISIQDLSVISVNSLILSGVEIGFASFVGASSIVHHDVDDYTCVSGNPAIKFAELNQMVNLKYGLKYPWIKYNRDGYPKESFKLMDKLQEKILNHFGV